MTTSKPICGISITAALAAAALSATALAEYRCATPELLTNAELRACDLAQQDSPDALVRFVNRSKGISNLYADDYVSKADGERWELEKRAGTEDSPIAKAKGDAKDASRTE